MHSDLELLHHLCYKTLSKVREKTPCHPGVREALCLFLHLFYNPSPALLCPSVAMDKVQHITRSAMRRASNIEVNPQTRQNLQELFVNFSLILICLLLICIIVMLL
ncbi:cardiac phospholamban [Dendropsophus ebraccatus]|uniref:cardiac phospholamban n=2 Tax=Hylinae TaxID=192734 RepID=UPI003831D5F9